jgi:hypothetical protein
MECSDSRNGSLLQNAYFLYMWVLKCFAILLKNRFMKLHFLEPIYGDETKMKKLQQQNLELEISEQFSFLYLT